MNLEQDKAAAISVRSELGQEDVFAASIGFEWLPKLAAAMRQRRLAARKSREQVFPAYAKARGN